MKSMTGFGRGEFRDDQYEIVIEMKSINHRYKDFFIKLPRQITMLEENIRRYVGDQIARGRVEVNVKMNKNSGGDTSIQLNNKLAEEYVQCLQSIKQSFPDVTGEISLSLISRFPDVISSVEKEVDINILWQKIRGALVEATEATLMSRESEGNSLKKDFEKRIEFIIQSLKIIEKQGPKVCDDYKKRLEDKIREYTQTMEIDEGRVLNEVAIFSDKVSISEEITRLNSHLERFNSILEENEPVGRKLDFLIQEMNREINTIGSKANDILISNCVVDMKSELEKMREQIQNIE